MLLLSAFTGRLSVRHWFTWLDLRHRDRSIISGCLGIMAFVFLLTALMDKEWFLVAGSRECAVRNIGVAMFYMWGSFSSNYVDGTPVLTYTVGRHKYVNCVNAQIVQLFRGLMGIGFVCAVMQLGATVLDLVGVHDGFPKWIRRNSILNIFAVFLCIPMLGLSYWISLLLEDFQSTETQRATVWYTDGFYFVIASAFLSTTAIAANLIRSAIMFKREAEDRMRLVASDSAPGSIAHSSTSIDVLSQAYGHLPAGDAQAMLAADILSADLLLRVPPPPAYAP